MAGVLIVLIFSFLFFFIFTRKIWVRLIKEKNLEIQLHLPLLAIHLTDSKNKKENKNKEKLGARAYIKVVAGTLERIKSCELVIKRVILPCKTEGFGALTLVRPFGYQGLIYAVIAYLKTKAKNLSLEDNAIISSPDVTEMQFHITAKLRLYQLIYAYMTFKRGVNEEKKKAEET